MELSEGNQQEAGLRGKTEEETEFVKSLYVFGEESIAALGRREGLSIKALQQYAYRHKWREARNEYRKTLAQTRGQGVIEPMTAVQRINLEIARKVMQYFAEDLEARIANNTVYEFPFDFFDKIGTLLRDSVKSWGSVLPLDEKSSKLLFQQFNQLNVDGRDQIPGSGGGNKLPMATKEMKELFRTLANSIAGGDARPPEIPVEIVPQDGEK